MNTHQLVNQFQAAPKNHNLALIEGVQALKHVVRFGGDVQIIVTADKKLLTKLLDELAPDVKDIILNNVAEVKAEVFEQLSQRPIRTKTIAITKRPTYALADIDTNKPVVLLDNPRDLGNLGAVIRVSAGADTGAVVVLGEVNPWHPSVIRGGAGLHFALPILSSSLDDIIKLKRPLIALDPTGEPIKPSQIPKNAVLVFGTERYGISQKTLKQADKIMRLPMREKVSSLNLATSVAATLYQL